MANANANAGSRGDDELKHSGESPKAIMPLHSYLFIGLSLVMPLV